MAVRRSALERVGPFDVSLEHAGDEQEWQDRLTATCGAGRLRYVAAAALDHRRAGADARLRALARAARARGRAARRFDAWHEDGRTPSLARELRTLAGCAGHVVRYRCPNGATMVAHSLGRLEAGTARKGASAGPRPARRRRGLPLRRKRHRRRSRRRPSRAAGPARRRTRAAHPAASAPGARSQPPATPPAGARPERRASAARSRERRDPRRAASARATRSSCAARRPARPGSSRTSTGCSPPAATRRSTTGCS